MSYETKSVHKTLILNTLSKKQGLAVRFCRNGLHFEGGIWANGGALKNNPKCLLLAYYTM